MVTRAASAMLAFALAAAHVVAAQDRTAGEQAKSAPQPSEGTAEHPARLSFEQGLKALHAQRWPEAEAAFRSSLAAMPRASARYDLALVVFMQGRLRESVDLLQPLLEASAGDDERYREAAKDLLAHALAGLTILHVTVEPSRALLRIDDEPVALTGAERSIPIDPGRHRIEVLADGFVSQREEVIAIRSVEQRVHIVLQALLPAAHSDAARVAVSVPRASAAPRSSLDRYGPWVALGSGGALLGASLATFLVAKHADDDFSRLCPTHRLCDPALEPKRDRIAHLGTVSDVLLATGAAFAASGLAWELWLRASAPSDSRRASFMLAARGRF